MQPKLEADAVYKYDLCDEEGIFYVTALDALVALRETRSLRAGRRSSALRVQYGRAV
jgi:hypothetical protein